MPYAVEDPSVVGVDDASVLEEVDLLAAVLGDSHVLHVG